MNESENSLKSGEEQFLLNSKELGFNLVDFWSWSQSNLLNNLNRSILAEYIVLNALGIKGMRSEWQSYDLETAEGIKIEVKTSGYLQSWHQDKNSKISFDIGTKRAWNELTNDYSGEKKRHSDIFIFCLFHHKDKVTANPILLEQWKFYVLSTAVLDKLKPTQERIALNSLLRLNPIECEYAAIAKAVNKVK